VTASPDTDGAYDWSCPSCGETYAWDAIDWDVDTGDPPVCPNCIASDGLVTLNDLEPRDQLNS